MPVAASRAPSARATLDIASGCRVVGDDMGSMTECVGACGRLKYPGRPDVDLWIKLNGCGGVANGYISAGGL